MNKPHLMIVAGARPNFMKIAPLHRALLAAKKCKLTIVHTGQHYDAKMSQVFFDELGIPRPDFNLGVGSASIAVQTARILETFDALLEKEKPDLVIVVGDVNSTVACSLAAAHRGIRVAHVEAGLRSFDRSMPEEINRLLTDQLSDFLFCTEKSAVKNLLREGVAKEKIFFTGNVMIDTLHAHRARAEKSRILEKLGLIQTPYAVATLHRPGNVDDPRVLAGLIDTLAKISQKIRVVFPIHPRTRKNIEKMALPTGKIDIIEPLGYLDFLQLISHSQIVLTDSGGIQEETTILGVPCLTLRENTERPATVTHGTNQIVGMKKEKILEAVEKLGARTRKTAKRRVPPLWDGKASQRIATILCNSFSQKKDVSSSRKFRRLRSEATRSSSVRKSRSSLPAQNLPA